MRRQRAHVNLDGDEPLSRLDEHARQLYRYARERGARKFRYEDVHARFGWRLSYFIRVVRRLRLLLGGRNLTLTCDPQGPRERWAYYLTDDPEAVKRHNVNRLLDGEARVETIAAMVRSIVNATDAYSAAGLLARLTERELLHVGVLIGELRSSLGGPPPAGAPAGGPVGTPPSTPGAGATATGTS